jgi:hypothetical protein
MPEGKLAVRSPTKYLKIIWMVFSGPPYRILVMGLKRIIFILFRFQVLANASTRMETPLWLRMRLCTPFGHTS